MPTLEEILAEIDSQEPGQTPPAVPEGSDNSVIKQLRDWGKENEKRAKEFEKTAKKASDALSVYQEKEKLTQISSVFKEVGLPEKNAALFQKLNPEGEVTEETVRAFAEEYALPLTPKEPPATEQEQQQKAFAGHQPQGWTPQAGSDASSSGQGKMSSQEFNDLYKTNPVAAVQAVREGRAELMTELPK
jgi:hypothetical protein